jgi:HPt (histidine-containing phosphotransfer) domain-containing protein
MFGTDQPLFRTVLARMLRDFGEFAQPFAAIPTQPSERRSLIARTHELKGSAGMIGATQLMDLCGAAEKALKEDCPDAEVLYLFAQVSTAYAALSKEADHWLRESGLPLPKVDEPRNTGASTDIAELHELRALLEHGDLACVDRFSRISGSLSQFLDAEHLDGLQRAMDDVEFPRAAKCIREGLRQFEARAAAG